MRVSIGLVVLCLFDNALASPTDCRSANEAIGNSTPSSDFTIHNNGTVIHHATGLIWMRCSVGQTWKDKSCTGEASTFTWQQAFTQNGTDYAGYSDWRLPNKNELASIVEVRCHNPSINEVIFPNTPIAPFWSSTPNASFSDRAWGVFFDFGGVGGLYGNKQRNSSYYLRMVRSK